MAGPLGVGRQATPDLLHDIGGEMLRVAAAGPAADWRQERSRLTKPPA